jgi:hypothetical protein
VREHLQEGVLNGLVGIVRIAQVVVRDTDRAPLLMRDQIGEPLAGGVAIAGKDERLDDTGQL